MKCPECGSEIIYKSTPYHYHYGCESCDYKLPYEKEKQHVKDLEHEKYQQRLDKVLAKLDKVIDGNIIDFQKIIKDTTILGVRIVTSLYTENRKDILLYIEVYKKEEWLATQEIKIHSLDTVEHIIKDMEAQDD